MRITSNSTQNIQKTLKAQKDKKIVFQKNRWKMQTCVNPYRRKYDCVKYSFVALLKTNK